MRGLVIDEHYREQAQNRFDTWLWLAIRRDGIALPLESFGRENASEYLTRFASRQRIDEFVEFISKQCIIPIEQLKWIGDDQRQINWLLLYVKNKLGLNLSPIPPTLVGKKLLFAYIDFYELDLSYKLANIEKMRTDWNECVKSDIIFKWFKCEEEVRRSEFAWEWLIEHKVPETYGQDAVSNLGELLRFYDSIDVNDAQKILDVTSIKKKWNQRKYRESIRGKKQYNFLLSDQAIADLDKLAKAQGASRPKIIEALIKSEASKGVHLKSSR